ncbi:MAG: HAD family hydrolase [Candidatus Sungbacteria bacterium]|uniref:HAD family hydrolase n=1 Tax=Candidatus Sungiibacteriota bacterium TaxID=2750080 RepID=A0A933DT15_9BACT|nr:HAD family hydrolase [Candidatus Sungbacteria bacterium]
MIAYRDVIRVIGFDLDQTLYPKSPAVDAAIQQYILEKIAGYRKCTLAEADALFRGLYRGGRGLSGSQSLTALGIPNGKEIVQEALERANIADTLSPDQQVIDFLSDLKTRYEGLDLITGSNRANTEKKLRALAIPVGLFLHCITDDDASKSDGSAYQRWLSYYSLLPEQFLYIGDRVMSDYEIPKKLGIHSMLVNVTRPDRALDVPQLSSLLEALQYI